MIKRFAIVKLRKASYHYTDTDFKCDLLVIRSVNNNADNGEHYIVRYPNGHTQMVSEEEIIPSSIVELNSPSYRTRHANNPVIEWQLAHDPKFHDVLMQYIPDSPYFSATKKDITSYACTEECTTTIDTSNLILTTEKPETIATPDYLVALQSIDKKLQILIELLTATKQ